ECGLLVAPVSCAGNGRMLSSPAQVLAVLLPDARQGVARAFTESECLDALFVRRRFQPLIRADPAQRQFRRVSFSRKVQTSCYLGTIICKWKTPVGPHRCRQQWNHTLFRCLK